jgi:hypothetical protein
MGRRRATRRHPSAARRAPWAAALLCAGCFWDYSFGGGYLQGAATIAVPIFNNETDRIGQEFDLTHAVVREIVTRTPYRLVSRPEGADIVIRGSILQFSQPALVQGSIDSVVTGSVLVHVKLQVLDGRTGKPLVSTQRPEWATFVSARGESIDTARAEVFDRLAQWVVRNLEAPW